MERLNLFSEASKRFFGSEKVLRLRAYMPELNFITLHYLYFIGVCMITSVIFYGSSRPNYSISYTDSLFLVVSAMTEAGLNTVNLSIMTTFQQIVLWLLILAGSAIWVSIFTVLTRKHYFERRFKDIVERQKDARRLHRRSMSMVRDRSASIGHAVARKTTEPADGSASWEKHGESKDHTDRPSSKGPTAKNSSDPAEVGGLSKGSSDSALIGPQTVKPTTGGDGDGARSDPNHISFVRYASPGPLEQPHRRILGFVGVGAHPYSTSIRYPPTEGMISRVSSRNVSQQNGDAEEKIEHWRYPHYLNRHTTGRNAQFYGLTKAEREHLGGVEYRAITLLAYVVPIYFVLWQLLGCLGLGAYMAHNKASTAEENGINPWYAASSVYEAQLTV
jgi:hypothetical protein